MTLHWYAVFSKATSLIKAISIDLSPIWIYLRMYMKSRKSLCVSE